MTCPDATVYSIVIGKFHDNKRSVGDVEKISTPCKGMEPTRQPDRVDYWL